MKTVSSSPSNPGRRGSINWPLKKQFPSNKSKILILKYLHDGEAHTKNTRFMLFLKKCKFINLLVVAVLVPSVARAQANPVKNQDFHDWPTTLVVNRDPQGNYQLGKSWNFGILWSNLLAASSATKSERLKFEKLDVYRSRILAATKKLSLITQKEWLLAPNNMEVTPEYDDNALRISVEFPCDVHRSGFAKPSKTLSLNINDSSIPIRELITFKEHIKLKILFSFTPEKCIQIHAIHADYRNKLLRKTK
ncbi:hypothetical protein [Haloferula sp.]|uniref:hypothetical protein n=1 Tax=Haloferula sp. TaxID=2497595 RepID=UPI0032A13FFE